MGAEIDAAAVLSKRLQRSRHMRASRSRCSVKEGVNFWSGIRVGSLGDEVQKERLAADPLDKLYVVGPFSAHPVNGAVGVVVGVTSTEP